MAITQVLRGDAKGAVKAVQDLNKAVKQNENAYEKSTKSAKLLEKQARRVAEQADPQKRYNRQVQELASLVRKGKVELKDAEVVAAKYGKRLENAGQSSKRAFGASAVSQITAMASGVLSLTAIVGGLRQAFVDMEQAAQASADNAFSAIGAIGEIQQLSPERQGAVAAFGRRLIREGIVPPDQGARAFDISFGLESQGFTDAEREFIVEVGRQDKVRSENLLAFAGLLKKAQANLFVGEDIRTVGNKIFTASGSAATDASKVARALPAFSGSAQRLGFDPNEVAASFIAVEKGAKNVELAETQFKGFLTLLEQHDLAVNKDLTDTIQLIQRRVRSGEKLTDILPNQEGREAFSSLGRFLSGIAPLEADIRAGTGAEATLPDVDPRFRALQLRKRAEGARAAVEDAAFTEQESLIDAIRARRRERSIERGDGAVGIGFSQALFYLSDLFGRDRSLIQEAATGPSSAFFSDEEREAFLDFLRRTAENTDEIRRIERQTQRLTAGRAE